MNDNEELGATTEELEQRARRLAAITESSHDAILSYDDEGRITEWLAGAERLFGYTSEEMIGRSIERIVPVELRQELWSINERIRRGEVVEAFDTERLCKDGRRIAVSVRSSPVKDREGNVIGISSTDRDITRQKEIERQLVEADRHKDEFLAMLGHELRNPLAAIRSAAELLELSGGDDPRIGRIQAILKRQTLHMGKLLDGLLDVSRIIRGMIRLETQVLDFAAVCREMAAELAERIAGRRLELRTELPQEPVWIEADPVRLRQIIDNLLSNAVKYTGDGGVITLALAREEDGMAALVVRDTGVGIEAELLPHIFEVFRQSKQNLDRSYGGLGLGLALVKSLTELHGGHVEARSEGPNRGSELVVRLPITAEKATAPATDSAVAVDRTLRILLIEDNEDTAEALRRVLELAGHEVMVAGDGRQGVAMAREHRPDTVLCDLGLPGGMSGFDVARELRADERGRDIRLVALSGYGRPEDKREGRAAGFETYLTKPVDVGTLERVLAGLEPPRPGRGRSGL